MTAAETLNLNPGPVLDRAADVIDEHGHAKGDFVTGSGYCSAGAIGEACGISPDDWDGGAQFVHLVGDGVDYATAYRNWRAGRTASLAALRAVVHHLELSATPELLSRDQLVERVAAWNDAGDVTASRVVEAMRAAARQADA